MQLARLPVMRCGSRPVQWIAGPATAPKLRLAKVVSARREGRHTYYTVEDRHVLALIDQIFRHIAVDGTVAPDR